MTSAASDVGLRITGGGVVEVEVEVVVLVEDAVEVEVVHGLDYPCDELQSQVSMTCSLSSLAPADR